MPLGTDVDLGQATLCYVGTQLPHGKGQSSLPTFLPMSIVAKQSLISATAELLSF